ncbi:hypothetical protein J2R98_002895 [Alkalibacillus filiformis]|uniref:Head decoration protein n=1 Tax=Alkalibacillus filiformis TaxID=200990 RepID=A0ABU0DXJ6_9BACI|nr:head decoration protein [Alkalibacillus filiformis]MDQ0353034.1 hypothetical protein [Alkalibacillus filiformis]
MQIGSMSYQNLIAGGTMPKVTDGMTLKAGQVYPEGSVLALDAEDKGVLVDSAGAGSVQNPYAILMDEVDATDTDQRAAVYLTGEFNQDALTFGGTDTASTHKVAMRNIGLFLKTNA